MRVENHVSMARWLADDLARRVGGRDLTVAVLRELAAWVEAGHGQEHSVLCAVPVDRLVLLARRLANAGRNRPDLAGSVSCLRSLSDILAARHHISDHEVLPLELRKGQKPDGLSNALGSHRTASTPLGYLRAKATRLCDLLRFW